MEKNTKADEVEDVRDEQEPNGPESAEDIQRRYDNGGMSYDEYMAAMDALPAAPVTAKDVKHDPWFDKTKK